MSLVGSIAALRPCAAHFRSSSELGHCSTRSALRICAMNRHRAPYSITRRRSPAAFAAHCADEQKSADTALLIGVLAKFGFSPKERGRMNLPLVWLKQLIRRVWSRTSLPAWTFSSYQAFGHCSISLLREAARCLVPFIRACSWHLSQAMSLDFE